jgi:hypothetical protein
MNAQFFTHDLPHLMGYYATHPIAPFLSAPAALMNGILMSAGIDALSVPAAKAQEFNENMVRFYLTKDATEMMAFLLDCHPDVAQIHAERQNSSAQSSTNGMGTMQ